MLLRRWLDGYSDQGLDRLISVISVALSACTTELMAPGSDDSVPQRPGQRSRG
jgi:hypothetical protein